MSHNLLHSTLRELQMTANSTRFWGTFAIVVVLFAVSGPYGTSDRMPFILRLAYWLTVHASAWAIAITMAATANHLLRQRINSPFLRTSIGALLAAVPISAVLAAIDVAFTGGGRDALDILEAIPMVAPLSLIFCLLTYLTMRDNLSDENAPPAVGQPIIVKNSTGSESQKASTAPPPILARLRPENRGPILHLTVEDHYTAVVTARGRELILLRFSDAIREVGDIEGLQVHRSHWVAAEHIDAVIRIKDRLAIRTKTGQSIPVSRTYQKAVRSLYALQQTRSINS